MGSFIISLICLILPILATVINPFAGIIVYIICYIPEIVGFIIGIVSAAKKKHVGLSITGIILNIIDMVWVWVFLALGASFVMNMVESLF